MSMNVHMLLWFNAFFFPCKLLAVVASQQSLQHISTGHPHIAPHLARHASAVNPQVCRLPHHLPLLLAAQRWCDCLLRPSTADAASQSSSQVKPNMAYSLATDAAASSGHIRLLMHVQSRFICL
jgi:hypothetical protein